MNVTFGAGPFTEGQQYLGSNGIMYVFQDGCFLIPQPVDADTVDGYSRQGVSDGTQLDASGAPIPVGAPIITFYDQNGDVINSKDCTELNDYAVTVVASAAGVDAAGNAYEAGDALLQTVDGDLYCQKKTADTDTFSGLIFASAAGIDDAGNSYLPGAPLLQLPTGEVICQVKIKDTVDGYARQGVSDGTQLDASGALIPSGAPIITFYDAEGAVIDSKDCTDVDTDTFAISSVALAAGTDDAGNAYEAGDRLIQLANGEVYCAKKTIDIDTDTFSELIFAAAEGTDDAGNAYVAGDPLLQLANGDVICQAKTIDTDTVDGYAVQGISDGSQLDAAGAAIPVDAPIITFYDATGAVINSKDCTDVDTNTFSVSAPATSDGIDDAGNAYATGDVLLQLPSGEVFCLRKTADTNTDTFSTLILAGAAGVDDAGNAYEAGDALIQLASGELLCQQKTQGSTTVPNADGSVHNITTSDNVVTPVCINPFADFRTNADGSITLLYKDGTDGPTMADTTIPADGSTAFGVVAADGTIVQPDGTTITAVYPNGDVVEPGDAVLNVFDGDGVYLGSKKCPVEAAPSTITNVRPGVSEHENGAGQTAELQEPIDGGPSNLLSEDGKTLNPLLDWDGGVIDLLTARIAANVNLPVDFDCVDGGIQFTYCDGSVKSFSATPRTRLITVSDAAMGDIDETTAAGVIVGSQGCVDVIVPSCGSRVQAEVHYTVKQIVPGEGLIIMRPRIAFDGVTFVNMVTGGQDEFHVTDTEGGHGENHYVDTATSGILSAGTHTICTDLFLQTNSLSAGAVVTTPTYNVVLSTIEFRCC